MKHAASCQTLSIRPKNDIYVFSITPVTATTFLAVCSDDSITAFTSDSTRSSILWTAKTSHNGTSQALPKQIQNQDIIITTGNDGTIKTWDVRDQPQPIQILQNSSSPILSLASHPSTTVLSAGTELTGQDATIQFWDLRFPKDVLHKYTESHSDDVVELHYHPDKPSCLLSGSTDGLINIYDTNIQDEDEAVVQTLNHGSAIHHTDWLDGDLVYGISSDEQMVFYQVGEDGVTEENEGEGDPSVIRFGDVRETLTCDYVVDIVKTESGPVIAAGSFSEGRLDLVPMRRTPVWEFLPEQTIRFDKGLGDVLVRDLCIDHSNERVIAAAEDNQIRIWSHLS